MERVWHSATTRSGVRTSYAHGQRFYMDGWIEQTDLERGTMPTEVDISFGPASQTRDPGPLGKKVANCGDLAKPGASACVYPAATRFRGTYMHKALMSAAALLALGTTAAQAQSDWFSSRYQPFSGFYAGIEGGANWMLNRGMGSAYAWPTTGWAAGAVIGYDFVGPRVELEGVFRQNDTYFTGLGPTGGFNASRNLNQVNVMANLLYDFLPGATVTPYIGAGLGVGFVDGVDGFGATTSLSNTVFAYQGIVGVGFNVSSNLRVNLDGRYMGTTDPGSAYGSWKNNNITAMLGITYKFGQPETAPPPPMAAPAAAPSFMVFFDWDRSNLSQQALSTIQQAADAYKSKGSARITATGHTDTSGPADYNMALSLRRANAVKDALVRDGVPATAISVVGKGETNLLVPTGDGVREPQNRRVEIIIQ